MGWRWVKEVHWRVLPRLTASWLCCARTTALRRRQVRDEKITAASTGAPGADTAPAPVAGRRRPPAGRTEGWESRGLPRKAGCDGPRTRGGAAGLPTRGCLLVLAGSSAAACLPPPVTGAAPAVPPVQQHVTLDSAARPHVRTPATASRQTQQPSPWRTTSAIILIASAAGAKTAAPARLTHFTARLASLATATATATTAMASVTPVPAPVDVTATVIANRAPGAATAATAATRAAIAHLNTTSHLLTSAHASTGRSRP